ncbi:hypothetical protein HN865_05350 [Candidatus Woesearchaeota archaeon]|jgi:hypothetical protein|nr:hypothetical protein [Candidatus Woesearchaeota archaeon]MBT7238243.1 hypothetical protein [Candidatus Woesearchaeota archaeon]
MSIVGFNFEKIMIEKKGKVNSNLKIKSNLSITDVDQEKLNVTSSGDVIKFNFEYTADYDPGVGKIQLLGNLLYMEDKDKVKVLLEDWKKDKKLPKPLMAQIFNTILAKSNIKALSLTQEVNLPPHIKLPILKSE